MNVPKGSKKTSFQSKGQKHSCSEVEHAMQSQISIPGISSVKAGGPVIRVRRVGRVRRARHVRRVGRVRRVRHVKKSQVSVTHASTVN